MRILFAILFIPILLACDRNPEGDPQPVFTLEDEKRLSNLLLEEIFDNTSTYGELIIETDSDYIYNYLNRVKDSILNNGTFQRVNDYPWNIFVVNDSFDASIYGLPGGHVFVSSGLLLYMIGEDELASTLAREMAYIDQGLAMGKILDIYGEALVLETFSDTNLTNVPAMVDIMRNTSYTIENEIIGDNNSVRSLCNLSYNSAALANLYERSDLDSASIMLKNFVLLPNDSARVAGIREEATTNACSGSQNYFSAYQVFKDSLIN